MSTSCVTNEKFNLKMSAVYLPLNLPINSYMLPMNE